MCRGFFLALLVTSFAAAEQPSRLFSEGKKPQDSRLSRIRSLNDKDFDFQPPENRTQWKDRQQRVREQILVATGLWPLPLRTPLKPVIHGRIDRDGYSVEKVYFSSYPGHYVTGNLYRPRDSQGKLPAGRVPGVLCPHGHWANGRFYDAGESGAKTQVEKKAEKTPEGARYPLQARCAQLARMGCVVFHYDMVGYADSQAIGHGAFADVEAEMRLQNLMGLQTWNSIRALDFLTELPEVDSRRIGVTGASGGGTQTFILCAIDERPAAAFPAVMVSTEMQGGCVCENCSLLRIGTGNVEFAGLFAPKPLAMSAANDWTLNIEKQGYPQLKSLYRMLQAEDQVKARCWPEFDHNYNQPAREMMYNWFNKHLRLELPDPVAEKPFVPVPPKQLSVFDAEHPRPADSANANTLRAYLTKTSQKQLEQIKPTDVPGFQAYQSILRPALRAMICDQLPLPAEVESREVTRSTQDDHEVTGLILGRKGSREEVPGLFIRGKVDGGPVILWADPAGKAGLFSGGSIRPEARSLLQRAGGILALDVFGTGELTPAKAMQLNTKFAGYTLGYNRPLLAQRVHDLLTGVGYLRGRAGVGSVRILGRGEAGLWAILTQAAAGNPSVVKATVADLNQFRFDRVRSLDDANLLPGALKYGDWEGLAGLAAPANLFVHNTGEKNPSRLLKSAYQARGVSDRLKVSSRPAEESAIEAWLLK